MAAGLLRYNAHLVTRSKVTTVRGVAQPGSVLAWGARGRVFESHRPDQQINELFNIKAGV